MQPKVKRPGKDQMQEASNADDTTEKSDVIVTGTSYAAATKKNIDRRMDPQTTFIDKNVRFTNKAKFQSKHGINRNQPKQTFPMQGSLNRPDYSYARQNRSPPNQTIKIICAQNRY